jgi:hypothetical protein
MDRGDLDADLAPLEPLKTKVEAIAPGIADAHPAVEWCIAAEQRHDATQRRICLVALALPTHAAKAWVEAPPGPGPEDFDAAVRVANAKQGDGRAGEHHDPDQLAIVGPHWKAHIVGSEDHAPRFQHRDGVS